MLKAFLLTLLFLFKKNNAVSLNLNGQSFSLEIAQTITQKTKGLSDRQSLCPTCGMIFIYHQMGYYPFWMKNTNFPLDIFWLDHSGKIVDIKTGRPRDLTVLKNSLPAQYVLELNPNTANLKIGDTINLSSLYEL